MDSKVFWAFWYHPAINIPLRVVGITMLVWSAMSVVLGLITNWLMISEPLARFFVGSPVRWTFWVMLVSSILITIASMLITVYYTYWHNRFVNTPMIIIAVHFYFFFGLAFIIAFVLNIKKMLVDVHRAKYGTKVRTVSSSSSEDEGDDDDQEIIKQKPDEIERARIDDDSAAMANPYMQTVSIEDKSEMRRDFRKKVVQMKPRNLLNTSYQNSSLNDSSFNSSAAYGKN